MLQWKRWKLPASIGIGGVLLIGLLGGTLQAAGGWPQWTNPATKIVPVVSLGTPGLKLGMAQVTGPKLGVDRVKAVLQLDGDFKSARVKILVPSDSYTSLRRVQGTAVTALLQYKLLGFSSDKKEQPSRNTGGSSCTRTTVKSSPQQSYHHDNGNHYGQRKNHKHNKGCKGDD